MGRKILKAAGILAAVVLVGGMASIPIINDYSAYKVEKKLCETLLPERTELVESLSCAGKLTGNGNGMQYFGAILIRSGLSIEELDAYYAGYRGEEWEYVVEVQKGRPIQVIEHGMLQFSQGGGDDGYYIVYSWGSGIPPFCDLDIRGH